jgi:rhamnosyltransferase
MDEADVKDKIAAVVILYNPGSTILSNINSYHSYADRIYVYDNTENPLKTFDWSAYPKIEYYSFGQNKGLAETLNIAAAKATEDGYDWLLTMDQDSYFTQQAIDNYYHSFLQFPHKRKTALFGPVFCYEDPVSQEDSKWQEIDLLITSGTLLNLSLFNEIGRFDEALFIDSVDFDYCIRAKLAGYDIIQFPAVIMLHELGSMAQRRSIKTLFLIKKKKQLHSPLRCYYMFRNLLYLKSKYRRLELPVLKTIERGVKDLIKRNLFYGPNTKIIIQYLLLAYQDYKKKRMGKFTTLKANLK